MSGGPIEVVSESVVVGKSSSSMSAEKEMRKVKGCVITINYATAFTPGNEKMVQWRDAL